MGCARHADFAYGCADCHHRSDATLCTTPRAPATLPSSPPGWLVTTALEMARRSPCRSQRGVVIYDPTTGTYRGAGYNGPPAPFECPGRDHCRGFCGQLAVHAEMRALRSVSGASVALDLVHVERAPDGRVVACSGPSCWQCSREIVDVGFVAGVWLYQVASSGAAWCRYSAVEFHGATLKSCGLPAPRTT